MNSVNILGRVTKDLELKEFGETKVVKFSLAVNRRFKKNEADFIVCKAFNKTAETLVNYCNKGSQIAVSGRIETGSYDKEGSTIYTTEIVIESFTFAGSKNDSQGDATEVSKKEDGFSPVDDDDDELPF